MAAWRSNTNCVSTTRSFTGARGRGRCGGPGARNSVNACATTAEIVLPDSLARSRTRATSVAGSRTVNTVVTSGASLRPTSPARST